MSHFIARTLTRSEERKMFETILKQLVKDNYIIRDNDNDLQTKVLDKAIEYEFLFLDPADEKMIFNSQIVKKGAEIYLERINH